MGGNKKPGGREDIAPHEDSPVQELRHRLSEPSPWARRFRRLAQAIVETPGLGCEECEDMLDLYVDDELAGRDVRREYAPVWRHLRTCIRCQQAHELLADTLRRERAGKLSPVPLLESPRLTFLQPRPPDAPWITRLRPQLGGAPFGLTFSLTLPYLRTLLSPPLPVAARAEELFLSPATHLLLSDTVSVDEGTVAVEVTATRHPEARERVHLYAIITGSAPLPDNLWAKLIWGGQTFSGPVDPQGHVDFGEVPLAALQGDAETGVSNFEIVFEARETEDNARPPIG